MEVLLCPSMMCANYGTLMKEVKELDKAGIDIFHCDVMDGNFVPNITMGLMDIKTIRNYTKKMIDVHLMVENPLSKIQLFIDAGVDLIYIHPESERYVIKTLLEIKSKGVLAGIAINPDTSIDTVKEMLNVCDYVMVMTVNPGFAGQKFLDFTKNKINKLIKLKSKYDFKIIIDGACSLNVIKEFSCLGVDGFILGTSSLFNQRDDYKTCIKGIRNI